MDQGLYVLLAAPPMLAGHYVSLIKSKNTWLYFDDDTVDIIPESTVAATFGNTQVRGSSTCPSGSPECRLHPPEQSLLDRNASLHPPLHSALATGQRNSACSGGRQTGDAGMVTFVVSCVLACCCPCRSSASTWTMATSCSMSECHEGVVEPAIRQAVPGGCRAADAT